MVWGTWTSFDYLGPHLFAISTNDHNVNHESITDIWRVLDTLSILVLLMAKSGYVPLWETPILLSYLTWDKTQVRQMVVKFRIC